MGDHDEILRRLWEGIDFDAVGLWRHLLRYEYTFAAWGLLLDLLKEYWHESTPGAETCCREEAEELGLGPVTLTGSAWSDEMRNVYRGRLMEVLSDPDGRQTRSVLDAYAAHRKAQGPVPLVPTEGLGHTLFVYTFNAGERLRAEERGDGDSDTDDEE